MEQYKKILGKVMMTAEGTYNKDKKYEPISLVTDEETNKSYISRKEVPAGIQINNREYWQPVSSSGIIDNGVIILNRKNSDGQIPIYDLKSATEAVAVGDRKGGVILGFLGFNPEIDTVPTWKLYQYNDVSPSNWTNIDYWLPMDYTNKYAGWFDNEEALYDSVPFPKVGMYAYVGNSATSAIIYRCYVDKTWQATEDKAFGGVVNLADEEDITSKQNKLKFKDKEYNPAQYNGMGRIYLRKNIVGGINILTQTMMQATNTIYIIQYDYDLQGKTITIPENCVLQFEGGSFSNGKILFNNTTLDGNIIINCSFDGKICNDRLNINWFGAKGDGITDNTTILQNVLRNVASNGGTMFIPTGVFAFSDTLDTKGCNIRNIPNIVGVKSSGDNCFASYGGKPDVLNKNASILLYKGSTNKIAINIEADYTHDDFSLFSFGGVMKDFTLVGLTIRPNNGTIGINIKYCSEYKLYNISVQGFGIGIVNNYGWSWEMYGVLTTQNYIGVELQDNSNACGIYGIQCHQNGRIGLHITGGSGISVFKGTFEGQPVGICIEPINFVNTVNINTAYFEQNPQDDIIIGADSYKNDTERIVHGVTISTTVLSHFEKPIYVGSADGVLITTLIYQQAQFLLDYSDRARNVHIQNCGSIYKVSEISKKHKILYSSNQNLIPNGFLEYPKSIFYNGYGNNYNTIITKEDGSYQLVIEIPNGTKGSSIYKRLISNIGGITRNTKYLFTAKMYKSANFTALVIPYDNNGSSLGTLFAIPTQMSVLSSYFNITNEPYIDLSIYMNNDTGETQYIYIDWVTLGTSGQYDYTDNVNSLLMSYSGSVKVTSSGTTISNIPFERYNVIVSVIGSSFAKTRVVKNKDNFIIYSDVDCSVDYQVVPNLI